MDWHWIIIGLVRDWNRIGMDWTLIDTGTGFASDWHLIGTRLTRDSNEWTPDWHWIDIRLGWIRAVLALNWLWIGRIDTGLASNWNLIGTGLALD